MSNNIHIYKCNGCGKELHTSKVYNDNQWVCVKCRKLGVKVTIKCSVCGKDFQVGWDTYRLKDPNIPWRCRRCNDDYRNSVYDSKSPEEKAAFVASQTARIKKYWADMSEEDREKDSQRRKELWNEYKNNGLYDKKMRRLIKGRASWYNSLSEKEKEEYLKVRESGKAKWWANLSEEEKEDHMIAPHEASSERWADLSPEEYREWKLSIAKDLRAYREADPYNTSINFTDTELIFLNELLIRKVSFIPQYPSIKIHPEFIKKFPINTATGSKNVDPTHKWDFLVKTESGSIFVDIDGSIHGVNQSSKIYYKPAKKLISLSELNRFNDSKRPYQTDGLPAYAIKCYDDKLTMDHKVVNINTGEEMNVKQFLSLIEVMNNFSSMKDILKDIKL